ncbi:chromosome partitioning protein ParB [Helicobacter anseris]|uniref:Chromosome partitioning protein ParB n=1 Tax=Helicobacter anseris TaxID=375926 RepID=A0A3D8JAY5_9HELI|nr:ParB/RepB/Spo0J family partition protein [Helicobacter anseris]RDU74657.1 chromosome partitioning protein ParB [Helicobacter anseris]
MKKKSLGRGLDAILGDVEKAYKNNLSEHTDSIIEIDIDLIKTNPYQPRKTFQKESLQELSESILEHGLLQPIIVYLDENKDYVLIAGERRLRASKMANQKTIKAIVAEIDLAKLRELALIENIQREDLNPIDLAKSYQELLQDYAITHEELAQKIKKSRAQITNTLRLLNLSLEVQKALVDEKISQGHAKVLVGLDEKNQKMMLDSIIGQKLSVRDTERMSQNIKKSNNLPKNIKLEALQKAMQDKAFKAKIQSNKIYITFEKQEEVEAMLAFFLK